MKRIKHEFSEWLAWVKSYDRSYPVDGEPTPYGLQVFGRIMVTAVCLTIVPVIFGVGIWLVIKLVTEMPILAGIPVGIAALALIAWLIARKGPPGGLW